jgi:amino acid transporter
MSCSYTYFGPEMSEGAVYTPLGVNSDHNSAVEENSLEAIPQENRSTEDQSAPTTSIDLGRNQGNGLTLVAGRVNFVDALGIVCGIIIGSGIFSSPGVALVRAGSPGLTLLAWAASGLLVILTATCYFELAGMMPHAGGDFEYIKRAFGERASFSFAWFNFWISKTASQAIIATIFGRYLEKAIVICSGGHNSEINAATVVSSQDAEGESTISKASAITLVIFITSINCLSVKESATLQNVLTAAKLVLVLVLFIAAAVFTSDSSNETEANLSVQNSFQNSSGIVGFSTAMVACLWSFDGWADLNFMTEELKDARQLPQIVTVAIIVVTVAYLLCNVAYMLVMPIDTIKNSRAIGTDFGIAINHGDSFGFWSIFIAFGVSLSTLGSLHGSTMTGGRAFYAVARDGKAPRQMAFINRLGSPYGALLAQGGWSVILLCLPGSNFNTLLDYCVPVSWAFYALTSFCVVMLRKKEPNAYRPFKVPLYPLPIIVVLILAIGISASSIIQSPFYCLLAFGFVSISFPVHMYWFEGRGICFRSKSITAESKENPII